MSDNPFAPPTVEVLLPAAASDVPDAIRKKIRRAWIAGVVSGAITLLYVLLALAGKSMLGFSAWEALDVTVILGLSFGIYKKSRVCASLMLVYFIYAKFLLFSVGSITPFSVGLALLFTYFYVQGVIGTFAYHKHLKQANA